MAVSLAQDWHFPSSNTSMDTQQINQNAPRASGSPSTATSPPRHDSPAPRSSSTGQSDQNTSSFNGQFVPYPMQAHSPWQTQGPSPQGGYPYPPYGYLPQQPHMQSHFPSFDPQQQSQQFAQWAYQQMMFNAQQQQLAVASTVPRQRTGSAPQHPVDHQSSAFYGSVPPHMAQNGAQVPPFNHSQTSSLPSRGTSVPSEPSSQAFHPYRKPRGSQSPATAGTTSHTIAGLPPAAFPPLQAAQPPYARDRNNSASSVNSSVASSRSSNHPDTRRRAGSGSGSTRTSHNSHRPSIGSSSSPTAVSSRSESSTALTKPSRTTSPDPSLVRPSLNQRGSSATSGQTNTSTSTASSPAAVVNLPSLNSSNSSRTTRIPPKPSPLSQQSTLNGDNLKRLSKDDSDLKDAFPEPGSYMSRSGGLKGRLRRALSFSAAESLSEVEPELSTPRSGLRRQVVVAKNIAEQKEAEKKLKASASTSSQGAPTLPPTSSTTTGQDDDASDVPDPSIRSTKFKKSRAGSLFNRKFNASTDNISLSSTVSSASLMIRKIGSVGALARRKSLTGITSLFKDKDKKEKAKKGQKAEADVSHVTVELDREASKYAGDDMVGLSPAAKLARQHTLRSNAEAAAKAKAQHQNQPETGSSSPVPNTWERDTASREASSPLRVRGTVDEDGRRLSGDHVRRYSEDGSEEASHLGHARFTTDGDDYDFDDDEDLDDGDVTVRHESLEIEVEPWAVGVRRSLERTRAPSRGILKNAGSYSQDADLHLDRSHSLTRNRANSYDTVSQHYHAEPGPLARIPSADPDHIDGLHPSEGHDSRLLPPLNLTDISNFSDSPVSSPANLGLFSHDKASPGTMPYGHPNMNSSAPTLSLMHHAETNVVQRSATAPLRTKRITFAPNLSVYDTFSAVVYDRRSEPATCNHLTPALAQRIKEELNSYKMEEMEVHSASRAHTQFFV